MAKRTVFVDRPGLANAPNYSVQFPFGQDFGFQPETDYRASMRSKVVGFLSTRPGERPLDTAYGCDIESFMFGQRPAEELRQYLQERLRFGFPDLDIDEMVITPSPNGLDVYLAFTDRRTNVTDTLSIEFQS